MLLRSSSTPVLGSLLSSFSESPNHHYHHHNPEEPHATIKHRPTTINHQNHHKLSFHHSGSINRAPVSCNSSPISPSISDSSGGTPIGFRRAQSEGNLKGLLDDTPSNPDDEFNASNLPKKFLRRPNRSHLETIPSLLFHNARNRYHEDKDSDEEQEDEREEEEEDEEEESVWLVDNSIRTEENTAMNMEKHSNEYGETQHGFE